MAQAPERVDRSRENVLAGRVDGFVWDSEGAVRFEVAMEALNRVMGTATGQLRRARELGDRTAAARARATMSSIARRQELLHPGDRAAVEAVIAEAYAQVAPASAGGGSPTPTA